MKVDGRRMALGYRRRTGQGSRTAAMAMLSWGEAMGGRVALAAAIGLAALVPAFPAHGQTVPGVLQESERVQREQEQRRLEQLQRDRASAAPPAMIEAPAPAAPAGAAPDTVCRDIRVVTLTGVHRLPSGMRAALVRPYQGRCLSSADIEQLLGDITKAYIDRGYAAVRAYLPAQDLAGGTLQIVVIEGRVSAVTVRGRPHSVNTGTAFVGVVGRPVNLRDLEQGIDQINRLASNHARVDLEPGAEPGDTRVVVTNVPTRRLRGTFNADNLGSRSTGRIQAGLTAALDDLLGLNELISVTRRQSSPFNQEDRARSSSETYFASLPLGYATVSAGLTNSRYRTVITTAAGTDLELRGSSNNLFAALDYVVKRNRTDQLVLTGTLTRRDNTNFVAGQRLDVGSRRLAVAELDLRAQSTRLGGFATAGLGVSQGLGLFDALKDAPGLPPTAPHARFTKLRANLSYYNGFSIGRQRIDGTSSFAAQYSFRTLFGSEQFAIGGAYSVRGFREVTLTNDSGWYLRNEVAAPVPLGVVLGAPLSLRPYLGLDVGRVYGRERGTFAGTLAGAAAGASLSYGRTYFDVFVAHKVHAPRLLADEGTQVFARMSVRI